MKTRIWPWIALALALLEIASLAGIVAARRWALRVETALLEERSAHQQTAGGKMAAEELLAVERRLAEAEKQNSADAFRELQRRVDAAVAESTSDNRRAKDVYRALQIGEEIGPVAVPGRSEPARGTLLSLTLENCTLRTGSGAVSVPLRSLPVELRARAALALVETPPFIPRVEVAAAAPAAPPAPPGATQAPPEPPPNLVEIRQAAQGRADSFFRYEYTPGRPGYYAVDVKILLNDPEKIPGWDNQWRVKGRGFVNGYDAAGAAFRSGAQRFEAIIDSPPDGTSKVRDFGLR